MNMFTMDDFNFSGKTVLLRVDINSHLLGTELEDTPRMREHSKTIKELIEKKAKVVILAHQGRPGGKDFMHLDEHARIISEHVGKKIKFVKDIVGKKAKNKIKSLKPGEALLLDNVRLLDDEMIQKPIEEHSKSKIVKELSPLADYFILDGFSVAHRSHASVVGFSTVLPSIAGRIFEREVRSLKGVMAPRVDFDMLGSTKLAPDIQRLHLKWRTFVFGGTKVDDCIDVMIHLSEKEYKKIVKILLGGLVANLFLIAAGFDIGEENEMLLKEKGYLGLIDKAKYLLKMKYPEIVLPVDIAVLKNEKRIEYDVRSYDQKGKILDIGANTIELYSKIIKDSKAIVMKGPVGLYEDPRFSYGTRKILESIGNSKGFSLIGGGDTSTAIDYLGINKSNFSYISLSGGAFIEYLSGNELPGIKALELSYKKFKK